jgi:hypothetical protein
LVVKALGDRMEEKQTDGGFSRLTKSDIAYEVKSPLASETPRVVKIEHSQVNEVEKPVREVAETSRVSPFETKVPLASETPRVVKIEHSQVKEVEKPVREFAETSRVSPFETKAPLASETPRVVKPERSQVKEFERSVAEVYVSFAFAADEKVEVGTLDIIGARMSQNAVVQTPESAAVSRLVETVVETMAVTPSFSSSGEGELRIQLKPDILDGSSIKIEVKDGELKVVVNPASRVAEEIILKSLDAFQQQLAERVTAWRINVGVAAFDLRNHGRYRLEEEA